MLQYSPNAGGLAESLTLSISATAKRMRAEGIDVAPFAAGEPDFDTPDFIREAGIQAIRDGRTKYGPAAGMASLREAIAKGQEASGFSGMTPARTIVTVGAKAALYLAMQVMLRPGDEVLVPTPCWLSYPKMVQATGATCVYVPTQPEDGYTIDPDRLRAAVTPRTRAIILNSPGNPTGAVQPDEVQHAIGQLAVDKNLAVISDEIYEHLIYPPAVFRSFSALAPQAHEHTLIVNGVSKAYAMTGWRIGYAAGPADWVTRMIRLQSHAMSGPPDITQCAALAALNGPPEAIAHMRDAFEQRRLVMHAALSAIPDLTCPMPDGAFYMLPDVSAYLGATYGGEVIGTSTKLASLLLEHAHAAVVPGDVFEAPRTLRFSYACARKDIEGGIERVAGFLANLARPTPV